MISHNAKKYDVIIVGGGFGLWRSDCQGDIEAAK
jgi:hypothetical protein